MINSLLCFILFLRCLAGIVDPNRLLCTVFDSIRRGSGIIRPAVNIRLLVCLFHFPVEVQVWLLQVFPEFILFLFAHIRAFECNIFCPLFCKDRVGGEYTV